jgi:hypothetical protein
MIQPEELNVRDLVDCASLVFTTNSLQRFKERLEARNAAPEDVDTAPEAEAEPVAEAAGGEDEE